MNIEAIKEKLNTAEYKYLTDELKSHEVMILGLGGSISYGTDIWTPEYQSDIDIRAIRANTRSEILTLRPNINPFKDEVTDSVMYSFSHICDLLLKCNPQTLEILATKDEHILLLDKRGKLLRDNLNIFLSQKVFGAFVGYATQQLRRLQNALANGTYPQSEKEKHILKSIEARIITFKDRYRAVTGQELNLYIEDSKKTGMDKEIFVDFYLNHYPLRDLKGMLEEMGQITKDFDKLNHRNSKKDEIHLLKHAMHLIRVLEMGIDILAGKGVHTFRENYKKLLDIRNGKYTYEEIFAMSDGLEKEIEYAMKHTCLPVYANMKIIDELIMDINHSVFL